MVETRLSIAFSHFCWRSFLFGGIVERGVPQSQHAGMTNDDSDMGAIMRATRMKWVSTTARKSNIWTNQNQIETIRCESKATMAAHLFVEGRRAEMRMSLLIATVVSSALVATAAFAQ
ncbi:MAG TPA: hypothetical protein VEA17_19680, partial [Bordetella sp.]|nr:hypothetical protein [Bordetella sp.]